MPRRQQQDCDAVFADKRTISKPPTKRGTHLKRQRQSRPLSGTETAQNHRKNSSLVPSPTPRLHKTPEKQQSRPIPSTETAQNPRKKAVSSLLKHRDCSKPGKTTVSSHPKHRDHTKPRKNSSLVPSPAPRPRKIPEKRQSRPISDTETAHYGRKGGMG